MRTHRTISQRRRVGDSGDKEPRIGYHVHEADSDEDAHKLDSVDPTQHIANEDGAVLPLVRRATDRHCGASMVKWRVQRHGARGSGEGLHRGADGPLLEVGVGVAAVVTCMQCAVTRDCAGLFARLSVNE